MVELLYLEEVDENVWSGETVAGETFEATFVLGILKAKVDGEVIFEELVARENELTIDTEDLMKEINITVVIDDDYE